MDLVEEYAPGFRDRVLHRQVLTPVDLEEIYGLTGGNLFHGEMSPDQLFSMRPVPGWARYRTPVPGLYLCGSGTHPGGGVMGAPGHNAAREVLRDLRGGVVERLAGEGAAFAARAREAARAAVEAWRSA
jgi:phytoene dehydrogenase-like protein